jgi:hypothetical protein
MNRKVKNAPALAMALETESGAGLAFPGNGVEEEMAGADTVGLLWAF